MKNLLITIYCTIIFLKVQGTRKNVSAEYQEPKENIIIRIKSWIQPWCNNYGVTTSYFSE